MFRKTLPISVVVNLATSQAVTEFLHFTHSALSRLFFGSLAYSSFTFYPYFSHCGEGLIQLSVDQICVCGSLRATKVTEKKYIYTVL